MVQIMDLEDNERLFCGIDHIHEKELDRACLEIYSLKNKNAGNFYELLGQSTECQGCPLKSILQNVVNGSRVKLDTRYGGVTRLRLLEHTITK